MQELNVRIRRLLGWKEKGKGNENGNGHEESVGYPRRSVPATSCTARFSASSSKRLRDSRDYDDPPAMKRYCNVSNTFPKIMPTQDESGKTPSPASRVRFIPIAKEDDFLSTFINFRTNSIRHSSPLSDSRFGSVPSSRAGKEIKTHSPLNICSDANCICNPTSIDRRNFHMQNSRFSEETPSKMSQRNRTFNDSMFSSRKLIKDNPNLCNDNNDDVDDDADDDIECLGVFKLHDNASENNDVIDVSDDTDTYELVLKPKMTRKCSDSPREKLDISNSKLKNVLKCQSKNHQPSYIYTLFPRKSTKSQFKSPKSITKPRVSLLDSSSVFRNNRWRDSQQDVIAKSFRIDEKKRFQELIERTLSNKSQSTYAKRIKSIFRKEAEKESSKSDVIDLTINLYPNKLSNGTSKSDNPTQKYKVADNSCVNNQEQSDTELITSADESSTTSSVQLKHKNTLEILLRHNQIMKNSWLENLNKRYSEISLHKEQEVTKIQEEKDEPELPSLTKEQEFKIDRALKPNPPDETLVEKFNSSIRRRDIQTLNGLNWLNDEIINFYVNLIMERSQLKKALPKVYSTNSFFLQRLMKDGHASLRRWTRKVDIFSHDLMMIPVHLGVHWCMSIINFNEHTIKYYDSMGGNNMACCNALLKYLEDEKMDKKKEKFDSSKWNLECVKDIPQQMNGSDCGMFSCMFAEYISRNVPISFSQNDMPYFRRKMVLEIVEGRLLM